MSYLIISFLIVIDQVVKYLLKVIKPVKIFGKTFIIPLENKGVAFNIFENNILFVTLLNLFLIIFLVLEARKNKLDKYLGFKLILAGGISNLIDRLVFGFVRDYFNFFDFFVFNLADFYVVFGVLIYFLEVRRETR